AHGAVLHGGQGLSNGQPADGTSMLPALTMKTALIKPLRAPLLSWPCIAAFAALALLSGCDDKPAAKEKAASTATAAAPAPATAAPTATVVAAATTGSAPGKVYDCGAKGQKLCPMQAWMKKVMAPASSAGDGPELAK